MIKTRTLPLEIEIYIPNELGYEKVAMASVSTAARKADFPEDKIENMKTALAEACTNAMEHGNEFDQQTHVKILLTIMPTHIQLKVIDDGHQPIPQHIPDRTQRADFRGMGLFLIRSLMDKVEVRSQPGRNEIWMESYFSTPLISP